MIFIFGIYIYFSTTCSHNNDIFRDINFLKGNCPYPNSNMFLGINKQCIIIFLDNVRAYLIHCRAIFQYTAYN